MINQQFMERMIAEEQARLAMYRVNWEYYDGDQKLPLAIKPGQPDDNVIVNLFEYVVDKGVSFLFGKDLAFDIDENAETAEEDYLKAVWEANRKMSFLQNTGLNGAICGHPFVKIVPRDGDVPRLVNLDPAIVRPFWNPQDIQQVIYYKIEYEAMTEAGQRFYKEIIRHEANGTWSITKFEAKVAAQYAQAGTPEVWPYDFAPIVDWQNLPAPNVYFGKPDIASQRLQNAINFVASNTQRIIRFHAHPKTVGHGFTADRLDVGPDDMIILPSVEAGVENLEMQSDLASSLAFFDRLNSLFLRTTHLPDLDPAKVNVGALSGFALKILYGDLLELTEKKRRTYGDGIAELNRRLLAMRGGDGKRVVKNVWADPLPANKIELANELDAEMNKLGTVSKQTAAQELGRDWENTEKVRIEDEKLSANSIGSVLLDAFNRGTQGGTGGAA
jgi:hypothetical protein